MPFEISGLQFLPQTTLQSWQTGLKEITTTVDHGAHIPTSTAQIPDFDDFNINTIDNVLAPVLIDSEPVSELEQRRSRVGQAPTGTLLAHLVSEVISLNEKQHVVVTKVLSDALKWADFPYNAARRAQSLIYVGGEGGVGKSQIVKAIVAGMDLLYRKHEVILMAPTGAAADVIGGNTYHTSLGVSLGNSLRTGMGARVRRLWSRKTIMIIDEVSMIDLSALSTINAHCKIARSLHRSSPDLFGGLPLVMFMGDFHQFPPVRGQPLWKLPKNEKDQDGKLIWHQFKQVIILDQQMRQITDLPYRNLLARARSGTLTDDDIATLNSRVITSFSSFPLEDTTAITKLNALRHIINRIQIEHFARTRNQRIFIFPALHTRTNSSSATNLSLRADDLLGLPDHGTKVPFPGLLLYTLSMPTMILTNICTAAGLVNGATGRTTGIIVDPTGKFSLWNTLSMFNTIFDQLSSMNLMLCMFSARNLLPVFYSVQIAPNRSRCQI